MRNQNAEDNEAIQDRELIARILRGKTDDFEILLTRYRGYVFKIVSGFLPIEEVADFCHDIFVDVYRALPQYDDRSAFKKWLASIAIRRCYDFWRSHYRNAEVPISALTDDHQQWLDGIVSAQSATNFAGMENQKEAREVLQWAMAELSAKDRMVLTLVHLEGFSIKEAAQTLGWSQVNVKVRAHRSREKMRKKIAELLEGDGWR